MVVSHEPGCLAGVADLDWSCTCPKASPNGIPPWDPPDDQGEWLAFEGWAEWVEKHGELKHRMQLMAYRAEKVMVIFGTTMAQAAKNMAEVVTKFVRLLSEPPP